MNAHTIGSRIKKIISIFYTMQVQYYLFIKLLSSLDLGVGQLVMCVREASIGPSGV